MPREYVPVRDKIPEFMYDKNIPFYAHFADDDEYLKYLNSKLLNKTFEFYENNNIEILADIIEIVNKITEIKGYNPIQFRQIVKEKRDKNGAFNRNTLLEMPPEIFFSTETTAFENTID